MSLCYLSFCWMSLWWILTVIIQNVIIMNAIMLKITMLAVILYNVIMLNVYMLTVLMLNAIMLNAEGHNASCHFAECYYFECHSAECQYAKWHSTKCHLCRMSLRLLYGLNGPRDFCSLHRLKCRHWPFQVSILQNFFPNKLECLSLSFTVKARAYPSGALYRAPVNWKFLGFLENIKLRCKYKLYVYSVIIREKEKKFYKIVNWMVLTESYSFGWRHLSHSSLTNQIQKSTQ